jgi:hypothetical protein
VKNSWRYCQLYEIDRCILYMNLISVKFPVTFTHIRSTLVIQLNSRNRFLFHFQVFDVSSLRLSCCINTLTFCVHYLCLIGRVCVLYVGHVDKSSLYETLFHYTIISKHHHHHFVLN